MEVITLLMPITIMLIGCVNQQESAFNSVEKKDHSAVTPVPQTNGEVTEWWTPRHEMINERLKEGNVDLLFIGNSIVHGYCVVSGKNSFRRWSPISASLHSYSSSSAFRLMTSSVGP